MTIRTPPNVEHDLIGGIDNNGGIRAGLDSGKLTVPFFIHLLLDQFRGEGLGDQTVGIGLSLGFDQFGFGVDMRKSAPLFCALLLSLSARRAWIEIFSFSALTLAVCCSIFASSRSC